MRWLKNKKGDDLPCAKKQQSPFSLRLPTKQMAYVFDRSKAVGKSRNKVIVDIISESMKEGDNE